MTSGDLRSISEVAPLLRARALSPVELVRACLARVESGRDLNAFITITADAALDDALRAEREIASGRYRGPLHGIPVSIKDLVDVAGTPTTAGSKIAPRRPRADAPIVTRLKDAGAIIIGKTNLHEFAFGTTGDESAFGAIHHPLDPSRSAGGSSSGAAVALAEGMCFGAVGTDTGGSIRIPSAACGTVGLKATVGELPCGGVIPLSTTLDHVGPMTRTVRDASLLFAAMRAVPWNEEPAPRTLAIGVPGAYFCDKLDPSVRRALERARSALTDRKHDVRDVTIDDAGWTPDVYLHIVLPESAWYHAPALETQAERYSPGVRLRLEMGRYVLAEDYVRAMRLRDVLTQAVDRALAACDALLLPTLPIPAPPLGAASVDVDGSREPVRAIMLRLTQLFNITGHPAIAVPAGTDRHGFPLSMQLVGHRGATTRLLAVAEALEGSFRDV
jgi:aspartyl-tRNA(Asn)/glutamyl-tRNA(Gln) amidotransferase subunit A